jgi:hypothetical protein
MFSQVLGLVGETLDVENEITGAVMSRRKAGDRIAIWNKSKDNETAILGVGYVRGNRETGSEESGR